MQTLEAICMEHMAALKAYEELKLMETTTALKLRAARENVLDAESKLWDLRHEITNVAIRKV